MTDKKPLVDPLDLLSESLFGVLMTLTFTGTMSVTLGEGGTVRGVLLAALACNLARDSQTIAVRLNRSGTSCRRKLGPVSLWFWQPVP